MNHHDTKNVIIANSDEKAPKFEVSDSFKFSPRASDADRRSARDQGVTDYDIDQIAHYAVPIVNYVNELKPHVVIGCDRGGRLITLAVLQMWKELKPDESFPTLDGSVSFAKISSTDLSFEGIYEKMRDRVADIVAESTKRGAGNGHTVAPDEQMRVLFIDDWTFKGRLPNLVQRLAEDCEFDGHLAVMEDHTGSDWVVSSNDSLEEDTSQFEQSDSLSDSRYVGVMYNHRYEPLPLRESDNVQQTRKKLGQAVRRVAQHVSHK